MARVEIAEAVQNTAGAAISGATVQVNIRGGAAATLYAAETGATTVGNPRTTTATGHIDGWVDEGSYTLVTTKSGYTFADQHFEAGRGSHAKVDHEAPLNVEYPEYGASPSNTAAQNSTAFAAAIAALPTNGGHLFFPRNYDFDTMLNLDSKRGVVLEGQSTFDRTTTQEPLSRLRFTGTGAGAAISCKLTNRMTFRRLTIAHTSASFTGTVIDFAGTDANNYATFPVFEQCWITGHPPLQAGTATGVDLKLIVDASFRDCTFISLVQAIKGTVADPATSFSNTTLFDHCYFSRMGTCSVLNPGQQWTFMHSTFQQISTGGSVAVICNYRTQGLAFVGCGFWDASIGGSWLTLRGEGTIVTGCLFGGHPTTRAVDAQHADNEGLVVVGNRFQGVSGDELGIAVDLGTGGKPETLVRANSYDYVTSKVSASDQTYAATSGIYDKGESGELSGVGLYPTSTHNRALEGGLSFPTTISTGNAVNNSIFRDSADNIIKIKDNGGTVRLLY